MPNESWFVGRMVSLRRARVCFILLLFAASAWALTHIGVRELWQVMVQVPAWMLVAGVACNFVNLCGKASSWHFLLPRGQRACYRRLLRYSIAAGAFNVVAPLRAGEGLRIYLLHSREAVPVAVAVGVALTEKLLNVIGLVALVLPLAWLVPAMPRWLPWAATGCGVAVLGLAATIACADRWLGRGRAPQLAAICATLRGQKLQLLPAFGCLVVGWLGDCALAALMLRACAIPMPALWTPFVLFVINLAIVVPSTPAQLGTLELAAVTALSMLGVANEPALAFALLYHGVQVLPLLLIVLLELPLLKEAAYRMTR